MSDQQPPSFDFGNGGNTPPNQPGQQAFSSGGPAGQPPKKRNKVLIAVLAILGIFFLLFLLLVGVLIFGFFKVKDTVENTSFDDALNQLTTTVPGQTVEPRGKATLDKYNQVQVGMTYDQVKAIMGGTEVDLGSDTVDGQSVALTWGGDGLTDMAIITFDAPKPNGKVVAKTKFGLD